MLSDALCPAAVEPVPSTAPSARVRVPRRPVHGVLLLDKPLGLSSNDALQKVKRLFRAEKAGHTGTLDPLASGLLPLCFGAATKFSQVSLDADKAYRATLRLGQTTSTGDAEGEVLSVGPVEVDRASIEAACRGLLGAIDQTPPMHSALKHQGKALYEYARQGVVVERAVRRVTIHRLDIVDWHDVELVVDVVCSKGTYVRTLAESLGEALGCGAHLSGLRRTASGPLSVDDAVTLEQLAALDEPGRDTLLHGPDALLADWTPVHLSVEDAGFFLSGMRRRLPLNDCPQVRVYGPRLADGATGFGRTASAMTPTGTVGEGVLLGSAHVQGGELIADRLLSPAEVAALLAQPHGPALRADSPSN